MTSSNNHFAWYAEQIDFTLWCRKRHGLAKVSFRPTFWGSVWTLLRFHNKLNIPNTRGQCSCEPFVRYRKKGEISVLIILRKSLVSFGTEIWSLHRCWKATLMRVNVWRVYDKWKHLHRRVFTFLDRVGAGDHTLRIFTACNTNKHGAGYHATFTCDAETAALLHHNSALSSSWRRIKLRRLFRCNSFFLYVHVLMHSLL